jgi:hypothetical protein
MYDDYFFGKVAAHAYWDEMNKLAQAARDPGRELRRMMGTLKPGELITTCRRSCVLV